VPWMVCSSPPFRSSPCSLLSQEPGFVPAPLGRSLIGVAALIASMVMTAVYHLGYSDFRSPKIARPVARDVVWSVPTLVTLNPIGAPIAHAGMHIAAVLHSRPADRHANPSTLLSPIPYRRPSSAAVVPATYSATKRSIVSVASRSLTPFSLAAPASSCSSWRPTGHVPNQGGVNFNPLRTAYVCPHPRLTRRLGVWAGSTQPLNAHSHSRSR
jgi:hypothetical protein